MKRFLILLCAVSLPLLLFYCEKDEISQKLEIRFENAIQGGCNNLKSDYLKNAENDRDTVIVNLGKDTLKIFAGLNYICCAPFATETDITGDSLIMKIIDTCPDVQCSYCKCMCYYTFEFLYTEFEKKDYPYKIILDDPRQEGPAVFWEGTIKIN